MNAASKALRREISDRVDAITAETDDAFALDDDGNVLWRGEPVASITAGPRPWQPSVDVPFDDMLEGDARDKVKRRIAEWLKTHVARVLKPLFKALDAPLTGAPRGLVFQLAEGLGSLPREVVEKQIKALSERDRQSLGAARHSFRCRDGVPARTTESRAATPARPAMGGPRGDRAACVARRTHKPAR